MRTVTAMSTGCAAECESVAHVLNRGADLLLKPGIAPGSMSSLNTYSLATLHMLMRA